MYNGFGSPHQPTQQLQPPSKEEQHKIRKNAYVKIIEQPAKVARFWYEYERNAHVGGSILGASSTSENKTYPAIQICGYEGRAVVVVSCVTKDVPYRPHPFNLGGGQGCKKGVCSLEISRGSSTVIFTNLGIMYVLKKNGIKNSLVLREEIRVDPFLTGFSHRNQPKSINLRAVRLCFQVFLENDNGRFSIPLKPVVSNPIYDRKALASDLVIVKLSHCCSYVDGSGEDIVIVASKMYQDDIQVRFFEEKDGRLEWEKFAKFPPCQLYNKTVVWFKTPQYKTVDITEPVKVFVQLRRPSDGETSEALSFQFIPTLNKELKKDTGKRLLCDLSNEIFSGGLSENRTIERPLKAAKVAESQGAIQHNLQQLHPQTAKVQSPPVLPPCREQMMACNASPASMPNGGVISTPPPLPPATTLNNLSSPPCNQQFEYINTWNISPMSQQLNFSSTATVPMHQQWDHLSVPSTPAPLINNIANLTDDLNLIDLNSQELREILFDSKEFRQHMCGFSDDFTGMSLSDIEGNVNSIRQSTIDSLLRFVNPAGNCI